MPDGGLSMHLWQGPEDGQSFNRPDKLEQGASSMAQTVKCYIHSVGYEILTNSLPIVVMVQVLYPSVICLPIVFVVQCNVL